MNMSKEKYNLKYYHRGAWDGFIKWPVKMITKIEVERILKRINYPENLLEIGCGKGAVCGNLSKYKVKCTGLDISKAAIKLARGTYPNIEFVTGELKDQRMPQDSFEVVICLHVLEHVLDPGQLLIDIRKVLKTGGRLLVRIPNTRSWEYQISGKNWFHYDRRYHKHHWTDREAVALITNSKFKIIQVNYDLWEYRQVWWYSILNFFGLKKISAVIKILTLPLQLIFMPMSWLLGVAFKNSGTVEIVAEK